MFSWIAGIVRRLWREMVGFSAVGIVGVTCDIITFNVAIAVMHAPKVYGSVAGTAIGTVISYLGNRYWVFRKRELRQSAAEISLFLLVSVVAMLITAACVAFNEYVLGYKTLIAANVAQFVVGQGLGSVFRFWALHNFVFPESHDNNDDHHDHDDHDDDATGASEAKAEAPRPVGTDPEGVGGGGLQRVGHLYETE